MCAWGHAWPPGWLTKLPEGGRPGKPSPCMFSFSSARKLQISHKPMWPIWDAARPATLNSDWSAVGRGALRAPRNGTSLGGLFSKLTARQTQTVRPLGATAGSHGVLPAWPGSASGHCPPTVGVRGPECRPVEGQNAQRWCRGVKRSPAIWCWECWQC